MTPSERQKYVKVNRKRPSQRTYDMLDMLLPQVSAYNNFAELEKSMIQHGYLPTAKNRQLRKLLDSVGLPYYGVVPPAEKRGPKKVKKPKVFVVCRRQGGDLEMRRWEKDNDPFEQSGPRTVTFNVAISDEDLFDKFPWRMIDGLGGVKEEERLFGRDFWAETLFVRTEVGETQRDIEDMKDEVQAATRKFQQDHPDIEVVLKMRKGVG